MEWIPYQRLTITTDLSREEVINRMRQRVGPKKRKNFIRVDNNIFSGLLDNDKFYLSLNKDYYNSWTPEITGTLTRQAYLNRIKKGEKVTITYNKSGQETDEGFNLHVYQLEHNDDVLIENGDAQKRDRTFSSVMFGLGTAFLIWPLLLYRYMKKKKSKSISSG